MTVSTQHPQYAAMIDSWTMLRDSYAGERCVKEKGSTYLPPTTGMYQDGFPEVDSKGWRAYSAYKQRAVYHNFVEMAVKDALGKLHNKPSTIKLPTAMERLRDRATIQGDSLDLTLSKINEEQLKVGRTGILLDLPQREVQGTVLPYLALYQAEYILNWDNGAVGDPVLQNLNLVVLDESEHERVDHFTWEFANKYRVLVLGDVNMNEALGQGTYAQAIVAGESAFTAENLIIPSVRGTSLDFIPFVFVNSMDLLSSTTKAPLETIGNLGLAIYRLEADYRQALFMQGQDTLVLIGVSESDEDLRIGADAKIEIADSAGDAKFIGVDSAGLPELREAVQADRAMGAQLAGQFVEQRGVESGDALRRRISAKAATLVDIALVGAAGLERSLRQAAQWIGANPEEVEVIPNLDFADDELSAGMLNEWMAAKAQGAPISLLSIWENLKKREMTNMASFEEEIRQIEAEGDIAIGFGAPAGTGVEDELGDDE